MYSFKRVHMFLALVTLALTVLIFFGGFSVSDEPQTPAPLPTLPKSDAPMHPDISSIGFIIMTCMLSDLTASCRNESPQRRDSQTDWLEC